MKRIDLIRHLSKMAARSCAKVVSILYT